MLLLLCVVVSACDSDSPQKDGEDGAAGQARSTRSGDEEIAGRWKPARWASLEEKIDQLESIGYAAGTELAGEESNVTAHNRKRAYQGLNLYVSGHAPEAILMDMSGKPLHRWSLPYSEVVEEVIVGALEEKISLDFWRRAHLFENGDLLAIIEGHALIKLDAQSNLLWAFRDRAHHDLDIDDAGRIFVLNRKARIIPRIQEDEPVVEDFVSVLSSDGKEEKRVSILKCFETSKFAALLEKMNIDGELLHTNTIELVDARLADRLPGVEVGHVLISCLFLDTIAILDLEAEKVVWARKQTWIWQHQPTVLDDGNILMLDNLGGEQRFGMSRVIELDPVSGKIGWTYNGEEANRFETRTCGSCQRLPNGNTLITESDNGRALEVTTGGKIVWEFLNPHRTGEENELVATLFEVIRLAPDFPTDWIEDGLPTSD